MRHKCMDINSGCMSRLLTYSLLQQLSGSSNLKENLVSCWEPEEEEVFYSGTTILDEQENYNGTAYNSPFSDSGIIDRCIVFNGTNNYISCGDVLDMGTYSMSISLWFKTDTVSGTRGIIGKSIAANTVGRYCIFLESGNIKVQVQFAGGYKTASYSGSGYTDNNWHHIVGVWNRSGDVELWIDNEKKANTSISAYSAENLQTSGYFFIGAYGSATGQSIYSYLKGNLDDCRVYNIALSSSDIDGIYKKTFTSEINLVAWWKFDEHFRSFNSVIDSHGTHNGRNYDCELVLTGKIGKAYNTKPSKYISIPDSDDFSIVSGLSDSPFSMSLWFYINDYDVHPPWFINKRTPTAAEWQLFYDNNNIALLFFNNGSYTNYTKQQTISKNFLSENTWYNITATYNGNGSASGIKIYLNSSLMSTETVNVGTYTGMTNTDAPLTIGTQGWNVPVASDMLIDQVAIWRRELKLLDVKRLYNKGNGLAYTGW